MPAGQGSLPIGIRHHLTSLERRYSSYGPPAGGTDTAGAVHRHVPPVPNRLSGRVKTRRGISAPVAHAVAVHEYSISKV